MSKKSADSKQSPLKLSRRRTREDLPAPEAEPGVQAEAGSKGGAKPEAEAGKSFAEAPPQRKKSISLPKKDSAAGSSDGATSEAGAAPSSKAKGEGKAAAKPNPLLDEPVKRKPEPAKPRPKPFGVPPKASGGQDSNPLGGGSVSPSNLASFDPDDPFGDILGGSTSGKASGKTGEPKKKAPLKTKAKQPSPAAAADGPAPAAQPATPPPVNRSRTAPPALPGKPPPRKDDGSGALLEASLSGFQTSPPEPEKKSSPWGGLLIVILLIAIAGGAGYGIWYFLRDAEALGLAPSTGGSFFEKAPDTPIPVGNAPAGAAAAGTATERTDFADVSNATILEIIDAPGSTLVQTGVDVQMLEESNNPLLDIDETLRPAVAKYLEEVHIGAFRAGSDPRVMLDGASYFADDVVHDRTGLRFVGAKDRRLVFRDKNDVVYIKSF